MAAYTTRDLVISSLKRIGVISGIETPSADLAADALDRLNNLVESWSTESLTPWLDTSVGGATLDTVWDLPPGYFRALRDWLAIELAPELGRPVDGTLVQTATEAKAQIQRSMFQAQELGMPAGIQTTDYGTFYNWERDE